MISSLIPKTDPPMEKIVIATGMTRYSRPSSPFTVRTIAASKAPVRSITLKAPPMTRMKATMAAASLKPRSGACSTARTRPSPSGRAGTSCPAAAAAAS